MPPYTIDLFLEYFLKNLMRLSKKKLIWNFFNTIMLRCILKKIPKCVIKKYFQIVLSVLKLFLNYFYATFK
jgi:hypothetical protein